MHRLLLVSLSFMFFSIPVYSIDKSAIFKQNASSVVLLVCLDKNLDPAGKGTGSFIREDGVILTNHHVITTEGKSCEGVIAYVRPSKRSEKVGKGYLAKEIKKNESYDLAILEVINPPSNVNVIEISHEPPADVGTSVVAIGHPEGGSLWTMTGGDVSAVSYNHHNKKGYDIYQTDTPLNPGNSGGPLINPDGYLIGVNSFVQRKGSRIALEGLGFAVQASTINKWLGSGFNKKKKTPSKPQKPLKKTTADRVSPPTTKTDDLGVDPKKLSSFLDSLMAEEQSPSYVPSRKKREKNKTYSNKAKKNDAGLNDFLNKLEID